MIRILHRDLVKQDAKIQKHARLKKFFLNKYRVKFLLAHHAIAKSI